MKKGILTAAAVCLTGIFAGCTSMPDGIQPVQNFEKEKYLGTWYEIARFDFVFERNLDNTSAEYSVTADGNIGVINRGYNYKKQQWAEAHGKAKFRGSETTGELKVSFFGPFYAPYIIMALDSDYKYALVTGRSRNYLWILSRERSIPDEVLNEYLEKARSAGYDIRRLIRVKQDGYK